MPIPEVSLFAPDKYTGYTHRPGAKGIWTTENRTGVEISALGLRDRLDRTREKPGGSTRWAVIGDSIVESLQVPLDKTFAMLAEKRLSARTGHQVEVINMGLSGATPAVIAERLRTRGEALELDGIIVLISASDFLSDAPDEDTRFVGYKAAPGGGARLSYAFRETSGYRFRAGIFGTVFYWLLDHSRTALVLNNRKNQGFFQEIIAAQAKPAISTQAQDQAEYAKAQLAKHLVLWNGKTTGFANARLKAFLRAVHDSAKRGKFKVVFAIRNIPHCPADPANHNALKAAMTKRLAKHDFRFVDVAQNLKNRLPPKTDLSDLHGFGPRHGYGHLNTRGHTHYAKMIEDIVGL